MSLVPIGQGIAASLIAVLMISAWIAIGSMFLSGFKTSDGVTAPGAILIGSGITSFALAIFCALGVVSTGVLIVSGLSLVVVLIRWQKMWAIATGIFDPFVTLTRQWVVLVFGVILWLIMWAAAISPPRSADAMRYHLAHVRQIVQDGGWVKIADYHYALPFGWSLSYLPFEILGLPQGSQLLGLGVLLVVLSAMVRIFKWAGASRSAVLIALLLMLHPASLRVFIEASADAYAVLVILTISALLLRVSSLMWREAALLGFASWIGLQSRYQLVATGIAATIVLVIAMRSHPARLGAAMMFAAGSIAGLILASPFYYANYMWFGNPVWPLMIKASPGMAYPDAVAAAYSLALSGSHTLQDYWYGFKRLMLVPYQLPLGFMIAGTIVVATIRRGREIRLLGLFGTIFLIEWAVMQPSLYPRFILLMLPIAVLCLGFLVTMVVEKRERVERPLFALASVCMIALVTVAAAVNRPSLSFVKRGDLGAYHRQTWFYRDYEWINRELPLNARILAIVSSGTTYYLDRRYRRADPWLSGVVDWPDVRTSHALDSVLTAGKYDFVLFENRDWSMFPGGDAMESAINDAFKSGTLQHFTSFVDTLYTSRYNEKFRVTRTFLFKHAPGR